tara:strand:+ start:647 stop:1144 length:498 start_codon:yes stop_codon:yes gene_type:complete
MATYELPRTEFLPHPAGPDEGVIYEVRDLGDIETAFGVKRKVAVKVQSFGKLMEDGRPFSVQKMMNLSGHDQSDLYKFRCAALGVTSLKDDQAYSFDDQELIGVRVGYVVEHQVSQKNGNTYGNIGSIWRLDDQTKGEIVLEAQGNAPEAATPTSGKIEDKDLPF